MKSWLLMTFGIVGCCVVCGHASAAARPSHYNLPTFPDGSAASGGALNRLPRRSALGALPQQSGTTSWTPPPRLDAGVNLDRQSDRDLYSIGRQVVFMYAPDRTYTVLARPGAVTDLELAPGERAEAMAIGDSVRWLIQRTPSDIFIKPVASGLYTSATLVTNYHRYQLLLVSVPAGAPWYQSIRWDSREFVAGPAALLAFGKDSDLPAPESGVPGGTAGEASVTDGPAAASAARLHILQLLSQTDMNYEISGKAAWKPVRVFELDGKTYLEFPPYAQSQNLPALFVRGTVDEHFQIANYAVRGRYMIYPHLFQEAELRLGRQRVIIRQAGEGSHG